MDNLVIQVQGDNKIKVEALVHNILNNLGFKKSKLKIIEKEDGITTFTTKPQKYYLLDDGIYVSGIDNVNLEEFRYLSKDYGCIIMLNFEAESNYDDIIFDKGKEVRGKLPDEQFII